jgi:hypothetical protein
MRTESQFTVDYGLCVIFLGVIHRFFMLEEDVSVHADVMNFMKENYIQNFHCDVGINKVMKSNIIREMEVLYESCIYNRNLLNL